ncbi:MAG: type IV toxin-antitoxin system AbiEi family antitoxin domain-containing protein [Sedimentisphaerales bacterium]
MYFDDIICIHLLRYVIYLYCLMETKKQNKILAVISNRGVIRPCNLVKNGISPQILYRLYRKGKVSRLARGLYAVKDYEPAEHHSLVEACSRIPKGVVCLLSALQFHDLTTQLPHEVWIAVRRPSRPIQIDIPTRVIYFSGKAFSEGVEKHDTDGVKIKVYCLAKTVVDCFKYRNKIGLDVAIEALRDCLTKKKCSVDEIWKYAAICRVANVIRPYLEAIV